jgi:hypothetical protein
MYGHPVNIGLFHLHLEKISGAEEKHGLSGGIVVAPCVV